MAAGNGDEVLVRFNGDSQKLQGSIRDAIKGLQEFGKAIEETDRKVSSGGPGGGGGSNSLKDYKFNLDSLTESVLKTMGGFGGFMVALNSTIGVVTEVASVIGGAVGGFLQFAETIGGVVVGALRQAGEEVANLTQQVFELNKSTEQNTGSWLYIYGGGNTPQGRGITQGLMNWTSSFSMQVPYTRQDLMGAVTALGRAGLSDKQVEQYMSTIADMGALNPQRNLTQAAWSIQGAMHGYSRMLKYDYGINPDELYQFGYDENNPEQTLLPALKSYLHARHMLGAAKYAATETFWGAESSFIDRLQNFGLQVGGTGLNGAIDNNSMFGVMKQGLVGLSDWWDKHSKQIGQIADFFKNILGGAFKTAGDFLQGLAQGLQSSGVVSFFEGVMRSLGGVLNSKDLQAGASNLGALVGKGLGALLMDIGKGLEGLFKGLGMSGAGGSLLDGLKNVVNWLSDPKHQQDIEKVGEDLGKLGLGVVMLGDALNWLSTVLKNIGNSMTPDQWKTLEFVLAGIAAILAGGLITLLIGLGFALFMLALPIISIVAGIHALVVVFQWAGEQLAKLVDWMSHQSWGSKNDSVPAGGDPNSGGGGSGGTTSTGGGGNVAYNSSNSSAMALHFYGATGATVAHHVGRLLDERDRGSYLAKRTPGGFSSLGILG